MWGFGGGSSAPAEDKKAPVNSSLKKSNSTFSLGGYSILQGNPEPALTTPKANVASTSTARAPTSSNTASTAALNFLTLGQTKMTQKLPSVMSIFSRPAAAPSASPSPSPTTADRKGNQSDEDKSESAVAQAGSRRTSTVSLSMSSIGKNTNSGLLLTAGSESSLGITVTNPLSLPHVSSLKSATASTRMELSGALLPHPGTNVPISDIASPMVDKHQFTTPKDAFSVFQPYSAPVKGPDKKYKYWLADAKDMEEKGSFKELESRHFVYLGGKDMKGRPIIVFIAKRLPDLRNLSESKLHEILLYVVSRLHDQVSEEYVIVYCHTAAQPFNAKILRWFSRVYGNLPRPYKKNLKHLYAVHASAWVKSFFALIQPFVKQKFWKKLRYVEDVVSLQQLLPSMSIALTLPLYVLFQNQEHVPIYGASLDVGISRCRKGVQVPTPVFVCGEYLKEKGMVVENLFKANANEAKVKEIVENFDAYEEILFIQDVHSVGAAFKRYLNELSEPLIPTVASEFFTGRLETEAKDGSSPIAPPDYLPILQEFINMIPVKNCMVLRYVTEVILETAHYEKMTKMNINSLSHIFGPILMLGKKRTVLHLSSEDVTTVHPSLPKFDGARAAQALQILLENASKIMYPEPERERSPSEESVGSVHHEILSSPQSIISISDVDSEVWIDNELYNADEDGDGLYFDEFYMQCLPGPVRISAALWNPTLDEEKSRGTATESMLLASI